MDLCCNLCCELLRGDLGNMCCCCSSVDKKKAGEPLLRPDPEKPRPLCGPKTHMLILDAAAATQPKYEFIRHPVSRNDTIQSICEKYGVSAWELDHHNQLKDGNIADLRVLVIPKEARQKTDRKQAARRSTLQPIEETAESEGGMMSSAATYC